MRRITPRIGAALAMAAVCLTAGGRPAAAQNPQPTEFELWRLPGWTFTPGVTFGTLWDSNVALRNPGAPSAATTSDKLFAAEPFGQLEYYSTRTSFSSGYHGTVRRYFDLNGLDGVDHSATLSLREQLTRRMALFVKDTFVKVPTTDQLDLGGVPYRRTGARYNAFSAGLEGRLTRTMDASVQYDMTWVDFVRKDSLLTGGIVNGVHANLTHRFTDRASFGGEYSVRFANLNDGARQLAFQDTGAVFRYQTGPRTTFEVAGGMAHLLDRSRDVTRTGPYARVGLTYRGDRAMLGLSFERSYVPSLAFGGTNQNQELRGYLYMPLRRNRLYIQESAAWHRTDPFNRLETLPLDSTWVHTLLGYSVQRWFRVEGFYQYTRQDTRLAGGQIHRNLAGVQLVVAQPMRIR